MKRLAALLLLLLPLALCAQNGGVPFVVPSSGTATGGSATNAQPPSTVLSNLAANVLFASQCYTSSYLNTNILVETGFGTAGANGIYNWDGTSRFTNGNYYVFAQGAADWALSNNPAGVLYRAYSDPAVGVVRTWDDVVGGAGPAGQDFYGPITNCFTNIVVTNGMTMNLGADSTNYYVNSFIGNDTNAVAGNPYRPWRTVHGCLSVVPRNSTIYITSAGNHALSADGAQIVLTNGCRLFGLGARITSVGTEQGSEDSLFMLSDTVLADITMQGKVVVGCGAQFTSGFTAEATNVLIQRCEIYGAADGLGLDTWQNVVVKDCFISATYDGIANWDNRGAFRSLWLKDTDILSVKTNLASELMHGISWLNGTLYMDGGSITVSNGQTQNACLYVPASSNAVSKFFLNGVRLLHTTTNGAVSQVCWFSNASHAHITGTARVEAGGNTDWPLVNSIITNGVHDHIVGVTNANSTHTGGRTNKLVDTTVFGSGFLKGQHTVTVYDKTMTAAGTNIWLVASGTQKINGGPTQTNISVNGGSLRLVVGGVGGTNWVIESSYP